VLLAPRSTEAAAAAGTALSLTGVTRRFGHKWALRGIELHVALGELAVIQGPNGGGKSTLLRVIATALPMTGGEATVLGVDLRRAAGAVRRQCAMLGSLNGLYEDLSARENLLFAARMLDVRHGPRAVSDVLDRVGLARDADERVRFFSSGMQRRLALARVLLREARLLLLDEPFNTLDADGAALVNQCITDTLERGGSVLVVLHDAARLTLTPTISRTMVQGRLT
jgi:heme ABC exporter ATP-binding subunit CcmA